MVSHLFVFGTNIWLNKQIKLEVTVHQPKIAINIFLTIAANFWGGEHIYHNGYVPLYV